MYYFVYGSLLKGEYNHHLLSSSRFVAKGVIKGYTLYSMGAFPAIVKNNPNGLIYGEVYEVTNSTTETRLDMLEGYRPEDPFYNKSIVEVMLKDGKRVEAYVYHFDDDAFVKNRPVVKSGNWRNRI